MKKCRPRAVSPAPALLSLVCLVLAPTLAVAQEAGRETPVSDTEPGQGPGAFFADSSLRGAFLDTRDGVTMSAFFCGQLGLGERFSLMSCGTGSGLLTDGSPVVAGAAGELSHYRLDVSVASLQDRVRFLVGTGMAEAQMGLDRPGFVFNPSSHATSIEASGPELAAGVDTSLVGQGGQLFRLRLDVGMAWLPGWSAIGGAGGDVSPFAVLTANSRF